MRNPRIRAGILLIAILALAAILGPLATRDPTDTREIQQLQNAPPSAQHPLGTDFFGRDVLSRTLHGARISLSIGLVSVLLSLTIGTLVGLAAGFSDGVLDTILMRTVDALLAIPRLFLLLVVVAVLGTTGVGTLIVILGCTSWFEASRLVRAEVLSLRRREYVTASQALGTPLWRLIARHVLPNALHPILVAGSLAVANIILIEAGLSYLGMGVASPTPSLGNMIRDGQEFLLRAPWTVAAPGIFVILTVLAFSILSEGLREVADPRRTAR
jgi:peptide/nickel transport system permease protein